jgi:FkbM family methyltransferase
MRSVQIRENADEVLAFIKSFLPSNPVIIEAGARDGDDTLKMAKVWPKSCIYTFEPVPELFAKISRRLKRYRRILAFPFALADKNGVSEFYLSELWAALGEVSGSSSLMEPKEHLIYDHTIIFPRKTVVQTRKLDDWAIENGISKIDFLWLDMQGYELNMLKASELGKNAKAIYLEVSFVEAYKGQYLYPEVKKWMQAQGFTLAATDFNEDRIEIEKAKSNRYFGNAIFVKSS